MRILIRVALWPVRIALTILEWMVLFVTHFVGIGCYLMAGGCVVIAAAGWLMGLATVEQMAQTLGIGFAFFVVSMVVTQMVSSVSMMRQFVSDI